MLIRVWSKVQLERAAILAALFVPSRDYVWQTGSKEAYYFLPFETASPGA